MRQVVREFARASIDAMSLEELERELEAYDMPGVRVGGGWTWTDAERAYGWRRLEREEEAAWIATLRG